MSHKFRIYSTDVIPTLDPDALVTPPATLIAFDEDPDNANYESAANTADRGSTYQTFSGKVIQDFGIVPADGLIAFSGTDALSETIVNELKSAYEVIDGEWYFTDGYSCWKIQFSREPKGFRKWLNILFAFHGKKYFSYEVNLLVLTEEI